MSAGRIVLLIALAFCIEINFSDEQQVDDADRCCRLWRYELTTE